MKTISRSSKISTKTTVTTLWLLGVVAGLSACTKERPMELLPKEQVEDASLISTTSDYIYVASTLESPRNQGVSRPFWQGSEKIVRFRFTQNSLDVVEMESDPRFTDNTTNNKPVLSIPVEHLQYRCAKNSVGECSNKEELDNDTPWEARNKFKPNFESTKVSEVNTLPIELENLFSMGACFPEVGARFVGYKLAGDSLNFQIERTYRASLACANGLRNLSDLSFSVIHNYSMVKVDSAASADYKPALYPDADQGTFGFFTSDKTIASDDDIERVGDKVTFMNRWNPNREKAVYQLTPAFFKPENASLLKATRDSFDTINQGLAKAGAKLRLALDESTPANLGDLRTSAIVMIENPQDGGLLGYGPSVANPKTGEIVAARVMMYQGVMKKNIRAVYEEFREEQIEATTVANGGGITSPVGSPVNSNSVNVNSFKARLARITQGKIKAGKSTASTPSSSNGGTHSPTGSAGHTVGHSGIGSALQSDMKAIEKDVKDYKARSSSDTRLKTQIEAESKHCLFPGDQIELHDQVVAAIKSVVGEGELPSWESLGNREKQKILDFMVPFWWKPILIHELGHNLGLRHNFQGSEDKDNFYSEQEVTALGLGGVYPFSSVMDYSYKSTNELRALGKYDVAALRFGYQREVELKDGTIAKVESTVEDLKAKNPTAELKAYGYCTDEHVAVNAGCKRFDQGTTYTEIAQNMIKSYESRYKLRSFRNNALDFSVTKDAAYASRIEDTFNNLRLFLEVVERLEKKYKITEDDWANIEFLKDLRGAADIAGDFLINVVTMPDVLCAVAPDGSPDKLEIVALTELSKEDISCSSPDIIARLQKAKYTLVAQAGKSFESKKDPSNTNPYADQIDVRGIWIDKILAAKFLLTREMGASNLDEYAYNYLDYRDMGPKVKQAIESIMLNRVTDRPVLFHLTTGEDIEVPLTFSLDADHANMIRKHIDSSVSQVLGIPDSDILFSSVLAGQAKKLVPHVSDATVSREFTENFAVTQLPEFANLPTGAKSVQIGSDTFLASPANALASKVMDLLEAVRLLDKMAPADVTRIQGDLKAGKPADPAASADEIKARALGADTIDAFVNGELQNAAAYEQLLTEVLNRRL